MSGGFNIEELLAVVADATNSNLDNLPATGSGTNGKNNTAAKVNVPDWMPRHIASAVTSSRDRSHAHHVFITKCVIADLNDDQIVHAARLHLPSVEKYGDRLETEVRRSVTKARQWLYQQGDPHFAGYKDIYIDSIDDEAPRDLTIEEIDRLLAEVEAAPNPETGEESAADHIRGQLMTTDQIRALPPPTPLIDGYLFLDSIAVAYGSSGVGKTHVTVDMAMSITSRDWWFGRRVTRGDVLYVVAEGASGIGIRTEAWDRFHGTQGAVTWLPEAVNIYSSMWASALAEVVAELRPALVVLDTFARCIVGADENSAKDVGQAVANLDRIRRAAGSCVLVVHHSGKDKAAGARGSTALKGALNTELEVVGSEGRLTLRNPKQKDVPEQPPIHLMLQPVPGTSSVVVVEAISDGSSSELPESVFDTLTALKEIDVPGGVSPATWQKAVDGIAERTFYRHRSGLLAHGHIVNVGTDKQPKYRPATVEEPGDQ